MRALIEPSVYRDARAALKMESVSVLAALVEEERARFPSGAPGKFVYGTAGFRDKADRLERVLFRVGILAALRSKCTKATIGVMVTASHNPVEDNGVKVVEPLGEMMISDWEGFATQLANASTDELPSIVDRLIDSTACDFSEKARVVFARDTRPSGEQFIATLTRALQLMEVEYTDYGVLTTPQLHYMVRCINTNRTFGTPTEEGYYHKLAAAFHMLVQKSPPLPTARVKVDGANGVGADKLVRMMQRIPSQLSVQMYNDGAGVLNEKCGADFVKAQQAPPQGIQNEVGERCASFDGDADRIVYFYKDKERKFRLVDGDKIASLIAGFISERLEKLGAGLSIGVVQTAYANGNATAYLKDTLHVQVVCTSTGVKHLHHKALQFDVGVYFEANGHGTVLFSQRAIETFQKASEDERLSAAAREAASQLYALTQLINQTVGDAISDLLTVEVILMYKGWNCEDWNAIYTELPNRQLKVKVRDRTQVKTTDFERRCISPDGLQREIDKLITQFPRGRSFVRPSGTEDVVRVYAEAETQVAADSLAVQVGQKVYELAGGIGELPTVL